MAQREIMKRISDIVCDLTKQELSLQGYQRCKDTKISDPSAILSENFATWIFF